MNGDACGHDSIGLARQRIEASNVHPGPTGFAVLVPIGRRLRTAMGIARIPHHCVVQAAGMQERLELFRRVFCANLKFFFPNAFTVESVAGHEPTCVDEPYMMAIGHRRRRGRVRESTVDLVRSPARKITTPEDLARIGGQAIATCFRYPRTFGAVVLRRQFSKTGQKQPVVPHGNSAVACFRQRHPPADVFACGHAPMLWILRF